jgi:hypothetical protein
MDMGINGEKNSLAGKIGSALIVAIVIAGTAFLPAVADLGGEARITTTLFLAFLGAIIAVQVIPGLMLFGMILKGLFSLVRKEPAEAEAKRHE